MNARYRRGGAILLLLALAFPLRAAEPERLPDTVYFRTLRSTALVLSPEGQGTGWVVSRDKKQLVTCQHVVGSRKQVKILFPAYRGGRVIARRDYYQENAAWVSGRVVRADVRRDLALIEVESLPDGVGEMKLAADAPNPGDRVHAVGCPGETFALWVYSYGNVRQVTEAAWTDESRARRRARVVETGLALNPGDSGGPLVNDRSELVGVNEGGRRNAQLVSVSIAAGEVKQFLAGAPDEPILSTADDWVALALDYKAERKWEDEVRCLLAAVRLDPKHLKAHVELAWVLNELKKYDAALVVGVRALEIDDKSAAAWREIGYALLMKGDLRRAEQALTIAKQLDPQDPLARKYLEKVRDLLGAAVEIPAGR